MPILKLKPACKEYLWGGRKLITEFHKEYPGEILAETWELSCHPDGLTRIGQGEWEGKSLAEYIEVNGTEVLGKNCRRFQEFPILVKLIDARDNLSIQVHPDNGYALKNEGQYGKTEMWYVVDCAPGAFLYYGFSKEIEKEEFEKRIRENSLLEVLNPVPVQKGDVLFIEAGTIHAIGKDIVVAEIQQNSNITYRVYDYGRVDKDGKRRDLHIEKALAVTNRIPIFREKSASPHLASCEYFTVDKLNLDGQMMKRMEGTVTEDSFVSILVLEGEGRIRCGEEEISFRKGDSLFAAAGSGSFRIEGACEALLTTIGKKASPVRIAVDMSSRDVKVGLVDMQQRCFARTGFALEQEAPAAETIARIGQAIRQLLEEQKLPLDHCIGVGAGIPGTIDRKKGMVFYSNNIRWKDVPFASELKKYIPLPVYIDKNTNCAALGEKVCGAAKQYRNVVLLTLGNGVGGSVLIDGKIFDGGMTGGTEIGHMVIRMDGAPCTCGRKGCLEAYVSIPALIRSAHEALEEENAKIAEKETDCCRLKRKGIGRIPAPTAHDIFAAAEAGNPQARQVVERYVHDLGIGIVNVTNIFRPDLILLGGVLLQEEAMFIDQLKELIQAECFGGGRGAVPEVRLVALGDESGLIGAANLI